MRAIVLGDQPQLDTNRPEPVPAEGEVSVRVLCAGVCETDIQLIRGYMGFRGVLGHEFVGVAESGPFSGRRVVGEINCACHRCATCRAGYPTHCPKRTVLGIQNHDGGLGNLCAQVLARLSDRVLVVGKHDTKLALLAARGLATAMLPDVTDSRIADIVVDCTGSATGLPTALRLVRPRGTIVLKTTVAGSQELAWAPFVIDEVTLVGSRCGPFDRALKGLESGEVDVRPLLSDRFALSAGIDALERAQAPGVLKVLLDVSAG